MESQKKNQAIQLLSLVESPGWPILKGHLDDQISHGRDYIIELMNSKPASLTKEVAFRNGMRVKAYTDLSEWIESQVKLARS